VTGRQGLRCHKTSPAALVQQRIERLKSLTDSRFINHKQMLQASYPDGNPTTRNPEQTQIHLFVAEVLEPLHVPRPMPENPSGFLSFATFAEWRAFVLQFSLSIDVQILQAE
jgi:hypothetical protein